MPDERYLLDLIDTAHDALTEAGVPATGGLVERIRVLAGMKAGGGVRADSLLSFDNPYPTWTAEDLDAALGPMPKHEFTVESTPLQHPDGTPCLDTDGDGDCAKCARRKL